MIKEGVKYNMRDLDNIFLEQRIQKLERNGGGSSADKISYNNAESGLTSNTVQGAIDEVHEEVENLKHHYSTEEKVVGEWVDGSLIYEKTYISTSPSNVDSNTAVINDTISINKIIKFDGMLELTDAFFQLNSVVSASGNYLNGIQIITANNELKVFMNVTNSDLTDKPFNITIQYTKND